MWQRVKKLFIGFFDEDEKVNVSEYVLQRENAMLKKQIDQQTTILKQYLSEMQGKDKAIIELKNKVYHRDQVIKTLLDERGMRKSV